MIKIFTRLLISFIIFLSGAILISSSMVNAATSKDAVCEGAGLVSENGTCVDTYDSPNVNSTLANALNLFSAIIGVIAVVMMLIGGLKFIMSAGDANGATSARNTIIYAAVGLVIVALAQVIVKFVLSRFQ